MTKSNQTFHVLLKTKITQMPKDKCTHSKLNYIDKRYKQLKMWYTNVMCLSVFVPLSSSSVTAEVVALLKSNLSTLLTDLLTGFGWNNHFMMILKSVIDYILHDFHIKICLYDYYYKYMCMCVYIQIYINVYMIIFINIYVCVHTYIKVGCLLWLKKSSFLFIS